MNDMQLIENVDFTAEIDKVREKIKLLVDVKNAIDNEMHIKQSIDFLEALYNRVSDLEDQTKNGNKFAHLPYYRISNNNHLGDKVNVAKQSIIGEKIQKIVPRPIIDNLLEYVYEKHGQ